MTQLKNDRYLRALLRQPVDMTPVWMMRQAGRYLPEYKETRAQAGDFMSLCRNAELACEVTLQPLRRYDLDAAILFSDILTIPDAMGLGLSFGAGEGPKVAKPMQWQADIIIFTLAGVVFPLFCIGGFIALLCNGIWRKIKGKSCGQTFAIAIALLLLLLMFLGLFFFLGASGIGPVPN